MVYLASSRYTGRAHFKTLKGGRGGDGKERNGIVVAGEEEENRRRLDGKGIFLDEWKLATVVTLSMHVGSLGGST